MFDENNQIQAFVDAIHNPPAVILAMLEEEHQKEQERIEFGWMENYVPPKDRKSNDKT